MPTTLSLVNFTIFGAVKLIFAIEVLNWQFLRCKYCGTCVNFVLIYFSDLCPISPLSSRDFNPEEPLLP